MDPIWQKNVQQFKLLLCQAFRQSPWPFEPSNECCTTAASIPILATNEVSGLNTAEISRGSSVNISMKAAFIVHGFSCSSILATFEVFEQLKLSYTYEAQKYIVNK